MNGEAFQETLKEIILRMLEDRGIEHAEFASLVWPDNPAPGQKIYRVFRKGQSISIADLWEMSRAINYDPEDLIHKASKEFRAKLPPKNPKRISA